MSNENSQGMLNGIKNFTDNTADAMSATLRLILTTGGSVEKSIEVAAILAKEGSRAMVDEQFGGSNCAEITQGLASLPPVPDLKPQPTEKGLAYHLTQTYFDEVNS